MTRTALFSITLSLLAASCDKSGSTAPPAPPQSAAQTNTAAAPAEPKFAVKKFHLNVIPADLKTLPQPLGGLLFEDSTGEQLVVLSQDEGTSAIRLQHVALADGKVNKVLHEHEVADDCEYDFSAQFELGALGVTDLDGDDLAEVTLMFKHACRSDISPATAELWMLEGDARATLTGSEILKLPGEPEPIGNGVAKDEGFGESPKLLEHARTVWRKHILTDVQPVAREPQARPR